MKLLHVVPTYAPAWRYGGPIRSVHGLCKALAARGHEVTVATTNVDGDGESAVALATAVPMDGVRVHYFESRRLRRLYYSPPLGRFLDEAVRTVDVVHTHSVFLWPTTRAARAARRLGVPYVVSPRGMLVPDLIRKRSRFAKKAWIALFERANLEAASAIHSTSAVETAELRRLELRLPEIVEIPNGVDTDLVPQTGEPSPDPSLPADYAAFLGRLNWKKGIERLLEALALDPTLFLVLAGNDEAGFRARLEAMAERLGVASRVRFTGFVDGSAKSRLLRHAAAVVLPSDSENFGNSLLEAMALGTPVVATPGVGLAPFIRDRRCGLVAGPDAAAIASAIRRLRDDAQLRRTMGENGMRAAREQFSWDGIAARFEKHYRDMLDRQAARV